MIFDVKKLWPYKMAKVTNISKTYSPKEVSLQDEIAKVYFSNKPNIKKRHRKTTLSNLWPGLRLSLSLISGIMVFCLGIAAINRIYRHNMMMVQSKARYAKSLSVLRDGRVNKEILKLNDHGKTPDKFIIIDANGAGMSAFQLDFKVPIDITGKSISLVAKGRRGGEAVSICLRDSSTRSYRLEDIFLVAGWSKKTLDLNTASGAIDLAGLKGMKIETDRQVYLRDVAFEKP